MRKKYILTVLLLTALALSTGCGKETGAKAGTETLQSEAAETEMVVDAASEEETLETETEDIEEEFPYYGLNDKEFVSKASMRLDRKIEVVNEISISAEDGALYIDGEKYLLSENACSESDVFFLEDIDMLDSTVEIFVPEKISEWITPIIGIYRFENKELKYLGNLVGNRWGDNLHFDGMNHIYVDDFRIYIPNQREIIAEFTINENEELELMNPEEGFPYRYVKEGSFDFTLTDDLPVHASRDRSSETYDIKKQRVSITRTDGRNWMEVVAEDGTSGWIYVELILPEETKEYATREWLFWQDTRIRGNVPDVGKDVLEIFDGLSYE